MKVLEACNALLPNKDEVDSGEVWDHPAVRAYIGENHLRGVREAKESLKVVRLFQLQALHAYIRKCHVVVMAPTGAGKLLPCPHTTHLQVAGCFILRHTSSWRSEADTWWIGTWPWLPRRRACGSTGPRSLGPIRLE